MFARRQRVPRVRFPEIIRYGGSFHGPFLTLRILPKDKGMESRALPESSWAVVVGVKVARLAKDRNLLKRRLRTILRELAPAVKKNYYYLIFLRPGARKLDFPQLKLEVEQIFKKARLVIQ